MRSWEQKATLWEEQTDTAIEEYEERAVKADSLGRRGKDIHIAKQGVLMQTTLTLQLDERIMQYAQQYAKQQGKSVAQLVTEYLVLLKDQTEKTIQPLPPITRSLRGVLRGVNLDEQDYKHYLEEKHR